MSYTDKERAFLIELTALSRKHNIVVDDHGGALSLKKKDCSASEAGYGTRYSDVEWLSPDDYAWDDYKHTVVRE